MSRDLTELNKLEDYLKANGFEYQREDSDNTFPAEEWRVIQEIMGEDAEPMDKHQIVVYVDGRRSWDVICHKGSYGCAQGLLEGMGDIFGPDVEGYLTAEDVIKRINVHSERKIDYELKDHCLICENALSAECTACDGDEYFSDDRTD